MPEQLQKIVQPVKSRWDALTKDQKIKLVAAIAVVLIAIALTLFFTLRTRYVEFVNGLDVNRLATLETALADEGIKYRRIKSGTALEVDEKRAVDAQVVLETNDAINTMDYTYADAFDSITMGTTDNTAGIMFNLAKQTQIAELLKRFEGVSDAKVILEIPENIRLFMPVNDEEKSRATAQLTVEHAITQSVGASMARSILRSVEGLEMQNIEITDQDGNVIYSGLLTTQGETYEGSAAEVQAKERLDIINDIKRVLAPSFFDDAQVLPNLIYDNVASMKTEETIYETPQGVDGGLPRRQVTDSSSGENTSPADAPGTDANNQQQTYQATQDNNSSFSTASSEEDFLYNERRVSQTQGPPSYDRAQSSISVILSRFVIHSQEIWQRDNPTLTDLDWRDYKNTNRNGTVITNDPNATAIMQSITRATGMSQDNIDVVLWEVPIFEDYVATPVNIQLIIAWALLGLLLLMLAFALIRRQKLAQEEEDAEPELSVEDLLVSTQLEEAKEEAEKLEEIDYAKESEIKKQIEKFVNEKPEAVAALLRNWLNTEDW